MKVGSTLLGVGIKKVFCIRARKFRLRDAWTSYIHLDFIRYWIDGLGMEEFLDCYKLKLWPYSYWYVLVKDRVVVLFQTTAISL